MKLAAILVPIAFLVFFPMLIRVAVVVYLTIRGKDSNALVAPITQAQKKILYSLAFGYFLAFLSSLCWAIYVFTRSIIWSVAFAVYMLIAMAISVTIAWRSSKRPKPSPEELNRQADRQSKWLLKLVLAMIIFFLVMVIAVVIIYAVAGN